MTSPYQTSDATGEDNRDARLLAEVNAHIINEVSVEAGKNLRIEAGYLVEVINNCTCGGADTSGGFAHERGCGLEPLMTVAELAQLVGSQVVSITPGQLQRWRDVITGLPQAVPLKEFPAIQRELAEVAQEMASAVGDLKW